MSNRYEVEATLTRKIKFTTDLGGIKINDILNQAEFEVENHSKNNSDEFDKIIQTFDNCNFKDLEISKDTKCRIDGMELIEEYEDEC